MVLSTQEFYTDGNGGFFTEDWFLNREIICGNEAKRKFELMLSLPSGLRIKKVLWRPERFIISLSKKNGEDYSKILLSREKRRDKIPSVQGISLKYIGSDDNVKKEILENLLRWLSENRFSDLFLTIFMDESSTIRKDGEVYRNIVRLNFNEWYYFHFGSRESTFLFMNQGPFSTRIGGRLHIRHKNSPMQVQHADYECWRMHDHTNDPHHNSFMDVPSIEYDSPEPYEEMSENEQDDTQMPDAKSVLYDDDIIKGGASNLSKVISDIHAKCPGRDIFVNCCCTPLIIGDDVKGVMRKASGQGKGNLAYNDVAEETPKDQFLEAYKDLVDSSKSVKRIPKTLNLVGFPTDKSIDEMSELIELGGAEVRMKLLPEISEKIIEKSLSSELQVLFPNQNYERIFSEFFEKIGQKTIKPLTPYGFTRTLDWYYSLFDALGMTPSKEWEEKVSNLKEKYDDLKLRAAEHKIGMVIANHDFERLIDETKFFESIPFLNFLEDMGFKMSILVYSQREEFTAMRDAIQAKTEREHEIAYCVDADVLEQWLSRKDIDLIYSDFMFDERVSRNGKNKISLSVGMEMGFEGAIRTSERILRIAKRRFNTNYSRFFSGEFGMIKKKTLV